MIFHVFMTTIGTRAMNMRPAIEPADRTTEATTLLTLLARASPIAKNLVAPTALGTVAVLMARVLAILTAEIMVSL